MKYPNFLRLLFCFFALSFISVSSRASHIVGADLRYQWISGNTYKIMVSFYADCGPMSAAAFATLPTGTPKVCVFNGGTSLTTLTLAIDSPSAGVEVTPALCSGLVSQCTSPSASVPGIKLFRYSTTYTLPDTSSCWRFVFNGNYTSSSAGRAAAITNISSGSSMQLIDTLNNAVGPNTNPVLHVIPLPYYGIYMPNTYNPAAVDSAGDSLVYALVPAINATGSCTATGGSVSYTSPTSYSAPLLTSTGGFGFDMSTGQMAFYPNSFQRAVVVYNIREFRVGVLVGTIQRELTVLIISETNILPAGGFDSATVGTIIDSAHYSVCATAGAFTASIHPIDTNAGDSITVSAFGLPAGATFNTVNNGTEHPVSTLSWNTTGVTPGTYTFYVTYTDDGCPMSGSQTIAYKIIVTAAPCGPTGIVGDLTVAGISLYPNPNAGAFTLEVPNGVSNANVVVYDVYGKQVYERATKVAGSKVQMDLSALAQGTYLIKVTADGKVYREKMVISR